MSAAARAAGAAAGVLLDRLLGEPRPPLPHPVELLGGALARLERATYRDRRAAGALHAAAGVVLGAGAGAALDALPRIAARTRPLRRRPAARDLGAAAATAAAATTCVAGRMLGDTALALAAHLRAGDLDAARAVLPSLAGRDPASLDAAGLARAAVESVAENAVDAVVAPALWAAVAGPVGAGAHKAASTLDSMVGHRSQRYRRFGWASARLDDAAAWLPARLTALLVAAARPRRAAAVLAAVRRDAPAHPSPNAGVAEAAFAAALGLRLGGETRYPDRIERRPHLGRGRDPGPEDVEAAVALLRDVTAVLAAGLGAAALVAGRRRRRTVPVGRAAGTPARTDRR